MTVVYHQRDYRDARRREYRVLNTGDLADLVCKLASAAAASGVTLPEDVAEWLAHCEMVKTKFPKRLRED